MKKKLKITEREKQVLEYIANGFTDNEIAEKFGRSYSTINQIVRGLTLKLNAANRTNMVYIACKKSLV